MTAPVFDRMAIIGIGLIGSSLARAVRAEGLARSIVCSDANPEHAARAKALGIVDEATTDPAEAAAGADLVMLCVPIGAYGSVAATIAPALKPGAILTDVGSVKQAVIEAVTPHLPEGVHFVPGHPLAGTEKSGPDSGFAALFPGRWCILTPLPGTDDTATRTVADLWRACGMTVERLEPDHHDRVLAITSHLPHLIAYTIVGTATDLEDHLRHEVIKYSASGFRDFTRIAGSDPTMWRDVFLNNREAVLDCLQRFTEDLTALQRAIRRGEGDVLFDLFTRTRAIRKGVQDARQA
ncbi:prephenate/arogenate dehydrogenase family protein [Roseospira marina]|uniref:prephenate dehydrogenase n=1 Tax=Roseospira marina TaxID=140057 RepID=A0A5M6IFT6_9PROT|nr:prephenate/arogenate dehydrogenase family protein [Roseospira marina]KAA5606992.1 prephenate/arogenate dehydrogenase family protein [Roseospira marina]MBB4312826.1 cyclohexadieny/prephenate dehydrogenase [Roseospira marina]MBB5086401.1 cyclohexadieny/prephenate dehydrogenase [Roseospira marina]